MAVEVSDIDIDLGDRDRAAGLFPKAIVGSQLHEGRMTPHKNGLYFQRIPVDEVSGLAAFPYKEAEERGYFKVDLLHNRIYDNLTSEEELDELLAEPVDWDWFLDDRFYEHNLWHLGRWGWLVRKYPPKSVQDLAVLMAIIRPGKAYLYKEERSWDDIRARVWVREPDGYLFKKSHGIAYALVATLHAKLIARGLREAGEL